MSTAALIAEIVEASSRKGLSQKALAHFANVSAENLSRMKKNGNPTLAVIENLAKVAGLRLALLPDDDSLTRLSVSRPASAKAEDFRSRHKVLAWSNSKVDNSTLIQKALLQGKFTVLLDAAVEFGLPRMQQEWEKLRSVGGPEFDRALSTTQRALKNIQNGYEQASA